MAYCLRATENVVLRKEVRQLLPELISTPDDMLIFIHFYGSLGNCKLSFPRGMRTMMAKWYLGRTHDELFKLYSTHKFDKIGHHEIMRQLHLKLHDDDNRQKIIEGLFKDVRQLEVAAATHPLFKKALTIKQLKRSQISDEVIAILRANEGVFRLEDLPTHALKLSEAIEFILPSMSLRSLVDNLVTLANNKHLKVTGALSRPICDALQVPNAEIKAANLDPIYMLDLIRILERKLRVASDHQPENGNGNGNGEAAEETNGTHDDTKKKMKKYRVSNPYIIKKLEHIFTHTLSYQPRFGCNFFITLSFRKFSKRQSEVLGMRDMKCAELQTILALTLLKSTDKNVTVMTFSDDKTKLKPVEWTAATSYERAMEIYEKEIHEHRKVKENIMLPLKVAQDEKKRVDVFITIVSSVGRTTGKNGKPPVDELKAYKRFHNSKNQTK